MSRRRIAGAFLFLFLSISAVAADDKRMTIGLIGDSTVATTYGWGPGFSRRVTDDTQVLNYAKNGATLESLSAKLDELLQKRPDYVLVQFGHNDQKRYGTAQYADKLKSYVERIKKAGGKPVVVSSVTRRNFGDDGKILPRPAGEQLKAPLGEYAKTAAIVAKQAGVPFLDLYTISVAHHNQLGPAETAKYDFNETDKTHFSPYGTEATAELVVAELKVVGAGVGVAFKMGATGKRLLMDAAIGRELSAIADRAAFSAGVPPSLDMSPHEPRTECD